MNWKSVLQTVAIVVVFSVLFSFLTGPKDDSKTPVPMDYSELVQVLNDKPASVTKITVVNGENYVLVERPNEKPAKVILPEKAGEETILAAANQAKVKVVAEAQSTNWLMGLLLNPFVWFILIWLFLMRRGMGQMNQMQRFQQTGARKYEPTQEKKTFADVAGCNEAKTELMEVVEFLKDPTSFRDMGAKLPRGVLLVGGPGNGKTLLAKAVAGEAGVPFFSLSASEFVEMFVGVGASRARDLFNKARQNMPSIIFIDEIDAIGRHRGAGIGGGHDEREQTLNEILVQMDGFTENEAIVIIAATNRPDILDPAVIRAGRFDRHIMVDSPDLIGRADIFKIHTRGKPLAAGVDLKVLAGITPGFSGADIANASNEAATVAHRRRSEVLKQLRAEGKLDDMKDVPREITMEDFSEGIDRAMMGPARPRIMSLEDRKNTAVHEVGHAGVGHDLNGDPIRKVTIMPRARALGFTLSLPESDKTNRTKEELINQIAMMMGGRVAQEVLLGVVDTGASNDFKQATAVARRMVTEFGMSELGHISISDDTSSPFLGRQMGNMGSHAWGPAIMDKVDEEVKKFLAEGYSRARKVVEARKDSFQRVVDCLLEKETILGAEFEELWGPQPEAPKQDTTAV